jgi:hypothetical protein
MPITVDQLPVEQGAETLKRLQRPQERGASGSSLRLMIDLELEVAAMPRPAQISLCMKRSHAADQNCALVQHRAPGRRGVGSVTLRVVEVPDV